MQSAISDVFEDLLYNIFVFVLLGMWATDKKMKMMNQMEVDQKQPMMEHKTNNIK